MLKIKEIPLFLKLSFSKDFSKLKMERNRFKNALWCVEYYREDNKARKEFMESRKGK